MFLDYSTSENDTEKCTGLIYSSSSCDFSTKTKDFYLIFMRKMESFMI